MLKRLFSASVLVVLVHVMASGADAFTSDKRTYFTFNQSVALPGVTLPAGTYMFRLADPDTSRRVIQVSDKEGTQSYALLLTMPAYRTQAAKDSEIRFLETPAGAPRAINAWWYVGGVEIPFTSACEEQIRSGRQDAAVGHVCHRELPLLPPRRRVERDHRAVTSRLGPRVDWRPPQAGRPGYRSPSSVGRRRRSSCLPCTATMPARKCSRSLPTRTHKRGRCAG